MGSNDGKNWTTLSKHSNENVITMQNAGMFTLSSRSDFYSMFKVQNQGSPNHLCCSGIEFYGVVRTAAGAATAVSLPPMQKSAAALPSGTPSHGNPASSNRLNTELNNVARNTNNCDGARALVAAGADLSSTNGPSWRHTPLHQACYHGRYEMAKCLVELGAPLQLHSNPCGRGSHGTPLELAQGGGHKRIVKMLEEALAASSSVVKALEER